MRRRLLGLCALALVCAPAPAAAQQPAPVLGPGFGPVLRQDLGNRCTSRRPNTLTGTTTRILYRNPSDPDGKPPAFRRVVDVFPAGTRFAVRGAPTCDATPPNSSPTAPPHARGEPDRRRVRRVRDRLRRPADPVVLDNVTFNNAVGPVMLVTERRTSARAVKRARLEGRTFITEVQPLPGTPPDGAALRRADLPIDARSQNGHNLVTTPRSCPASRRWTFNVSLTYGDGVTQRVRDTTPCVLSVRQRRAARRRARTPGFTG